MSDLRPELRRDAPVDMSDIGEHAELAGRIREEIRERGPMTFARFMELALYDADGGYYRSGEARPGRGGDFLTAPELHPIFGMLLGTAVEQVWERLGRPDPFVVREHGAGEGALAAPLLEALRATPLARRVRYEPVEVDERRLARLRDRLALEGLADVLAPIADGQIEGVVIANEVLDALPVHRVRVRDGSLRELAVDVGPGDAFVETEIGPTSAALAERLAAEGIALAEGQTAEVCLALDTWIAAAAAPLRRGLLLLVDYGAPASELYDARRRYGGTLRAYVRHRVHTDPFRHVGRQDLTAHVDLTAVERAAHAAGLTTVGITTQAEALVGLGAEDRLRAVQADPSTTLEEYTELRSSLLRLLDPAAMGRFAVMGFGRAWPDPGDPLGLFAFRSGRPPGRPY
jgi:SAM-dependent MidA family methyltransferase